MNLSSTTATMPIQRLIGALLLSMLAACGGGDESAQAQATTQARTESDFAADSSLRLNYGAVGVTFMEAKGAAGSSDVSDTGGAGMDVMPLHIAQQTTTTYSLDPKDDTLEKIQLVRLPDKQLVFEINASAPSATVALAPGDYDLLLYSGHKDAQPRTVFLQNKLTAAVLEGGVGTQAGVALTPKDQLITTNSCPGCNLIGANLERANLLRANLTSANLGSANLTDANLTSAILVDVILFNANLTSAILNSANLVDARLTAANLASANLTDANLTSAILYSTNLSNANLTSANLYGATLISADLSRTNLRQTLLTRANFTRADMRYLDRTGVDFTGAIGYQR